MKFIHVPAFLSRLRARGFPSSPFLLVLLCQTQLRLNVNPGKTGPDHGAQGRGRETWRGDGDDQREARRRERVLNTSLQLC